MEEDIKKISKINEESKNNKIAYIVLAIAVIAILLIIVVVSIPRDKLPINEGKMTNEIITSDVVVPKNEVIVSEVLANNIYNYIPPLYIEGKAPFDDYYILDASIKKMSSVEGNNADFSYDNVNSIAKGLFGTEINIDRDKVSIQNIDKSVYYYNKEIEKFDAIPAGFGYCFSAQVLKCVTKKDDTYYLYNYAICGTYEIEFGGDDGMDIKKVTLVIGDKDGKDLVQSFNTMSEMSDTSYWVKNHKEKLPVIRYSLVQDSTDDNKYYIKEVEQIGQ